MRGWLIGDGQTGGRWTDGHTDGQMDRQKDDTQTHGRAGRQTHKDETHADPSANTALPPADPQTTPGHHRNNTAPPSLPAARGPLGAPTRSARSTQPSGYNCTSEAEGRRRGAAAPSQPRQDSARWGSSCPMVTLSCHSRAGTPTPGPRAPACASCTPNSAFPGSHAQAACPPTPVTRSKDTGREGGGNKPPSPCPAPPQGHLHPPPASSSVRLDIQQETSGLRVLPQTEPTRTHGLHSR